MCVNMSLSARMANCRARDGINHSPMPCPASTNYCGLTVLNTSWGLERFRLSWWEQCEGSSCIVVLPNKEDRLGARLHTTLSALTCLDFRKNNSCPTTKSKLQKDKNGGIYTLLSARKKYWLVGILFLSYLWLFFLHTYFIVFSLTIISYIFIPYIFFSLSYLATSFSFPLKR
jgi:hypothetical protein